jgi:hypothetical protein
MSTGNGLALIFYGDPITEFSRTKGGTRSIRGGTGGAGATISEVNIANEVKVFESFLSHCHFILHSSISQTTVKLENHDCLAEGQPGRPDAAELLPKVNPKNWKTILSRYSFSVQPQDEHLLQRDIHWTLILSEITRDETLPSYEEGEEYIASVVCFPQSWLSWIDNEWFFNNLQEWYIQGGMKEIFGVPSATSARQKEMSDVAAGRFHFRLCNIPNTATTKIDEGCTTVDVSEVRVQSGYTDHSSGILFPEGLMYVILCHLPSTYKIARHEVSDVRECVLCSDERPATDLGLVFGTCGHYICYQCSKDYKDNLEGETRCYYCRRPTSVKMTRAPAEGHEHALVGVKRHSSDISPEQAQMKQIMQRMQRI